MHARKHNHRLAALVSTLLTIVLIGAGAFVWSSSHKATSNALQTVVTVPQPPTAAQIALSEKCTGFVDKMTPGIDAAVLDVGNCYVDGKKYAINTFASPASRDAWLKVAEPFGVVPKWETATSVTYLSIANS